VVSILPGKQVALNLISINLKPLKPAILSLPKKMVLSYVFQVSQIQSLDFYDPILQVLNFTTCPAAGQPNQLLVLLRIQHQPFVKEHAAHDRERKGSM